MFLALSRKRALRPEAVRDREFTLRGWARVTNPAAPETANAVGGVAGGALVEAYYAFTSHAHPAAGGALAVVLAAVVGLTIGCCCGFGWGLLLGSSSPKLVGHLARVSGPLNEPPPPYWQPAVAYVAFSGQTFRKVGPSHAVLLLRVTQVPSQTLARNQTLDSQVAVGEAHLYFASG